MDWGCSPRSPLREGRRSGDLKRGLTKKFSPVQFAALPHTAQTHVRWFRLFRRRPRCVDSERDHSCFINHSGEPNTGAPPNAALPITTVALRDIAAGEELTCDYFAFDREAESKLAIA